MVCHWPCGNFWGTKRGQQNRAAAHPHPTPGGRGWPRARTYLSRGWAGSGPGRRAFSSAACSRCHGGLREDRGEDPWSPTAPPPQPGVQEGSGATHPLPGTQRWVWEGTEGTYQSCLAPQGHRASPVSASCPHHSCLFRRCQGHTE